MRDTDVTMRIQEKNENTRDTSEIIEHRNKLRMYKIVT